MSDTMADNLKRKLSTKSITAFIVFGAIIAVFVFFGLPGRLGAGVGSVARVNNTLISMADFQQEENRILQYYQNIFGGKMDLGPQRQLFQQQAIESLVRNELVAQNAKENGILATDAEVRNFIVKDIPFLQQNGQFQREFYSRYLESTRTTPADFEGKVRKDIASVRVRRLFEASNRLTQVELNKLQEVRSKKINVLFVKLDQEALNKAMTKEKADAEINALSEALNKGDNAALEAKLKNMKASWEETGFTDLESGTLPKISSTVATDAVFELSKEAPLLKRLVRDGSTAYLLKLKESKIEAAKPLDVKMVEMNQKRRGDGMFEAWTNDYRSKSHVSMNSEALQLR